MNTLYVVMPAYNEADNLKTVVKEWYPVVEKHNNEGLSRLVVVNDGSRDETYEIGLKLMKEYPLFEIIDKENSGHGATVLYAYNYAIDKGADFVFQTDSDGQTRPEEFEQFWSIRNDYDAIIGHRNHRQDGFSRIIVTKTLKLVLKVVFRTDVTDANTPFRLMKTEALKECIKKIPDEFNLSNVLLTVLLIKNNKKVRFLPITFRPRQGGVNSINIPRIIKIGIQAVKDFSKFNRENR